MNARKILDAALLALTACGAAAAAGCFVRAGRVLLMQQSLSQHMERTEPEQVPLKGETIPHRSDLAYAEGSYTPAAGYTTTAMGMGIMGVGLETHGEGEKDPISQGIGIEDIIRFEAERSGRNADEVRMRI